MKQIVFDEKTIEFLNNEKEKALDDIAVTIIHKDTLEQKDKEIERLKKELEKQNIDYGLEIERLNNIINELEKWAKEELEHPNWASCGARCMLDKLKKLKGDSSNV